MPTTEAQLHHRRTYLNLVTNRALVAMIFCTGSRISEIMSLTALQVQQHDRIRTSVEIIGKGQKPRPIRFDETARTWIADYLAIQATWYPNASGLFLSHGPRADGKPLTVRSAELIVKDAAVWLANQRETEGAAPEEVDALREVSPHSLRHFLAQAMLDEGVDFQDIAPILGHSSSIVTQQVYARVSDERTVEIADTYAPRVNMADLGALSSTRNPDTR